MGKMIESQHDMEANKEALNLPNQEIISQLPNNPDLQYELIEQGLLNPEQLAGLLHTVVEDLWSKNDDYA